MRKLSFGVGIVAAVAAIVATLCLVFFKLQPRFGKRTSRLIKTLQQFQAAARKTLRHLHLVPLIKQLVGFYQVLVLPHHLMASP